MKKFIDFYEVMGFKQRKQMARRMAKMAKSSIAKFKKIDAEEALRTTNNKFIKRFQYIEQEVAKRGKELKDTPLEELEKYWQEAKQDKSWS